MKGRPRGSMNRTGSTAELARMAVGDRRYIETSLARYPAVMRTANVAYTRRPPELRNRDFTTTLYTAVSASRAGDVRYLVCLERIK